MSSPPRSVIQTRRMKNEASSKLVENNGEPSAQQPQPMPEQQSENNMEAKKDLVKPQPPRSNKSVSSSVFMARKMQLELEAAECKARIDKELVDKKLALEIAALEVQSNRSDRSHRSASSSYKKVEEWLVRSDHVTEQKPHQELETTSYVNGEPTAVPADNPSAPCADYPAAAAARADYPAAAAARADFPVTAAARADFPAAAAGSTDKPPTKPAPQPATQPTPQPAVRTASLQSSRDPSDIEKLANALQSAISASTSKAHSPELVARLVTSKDLPLYFGDPMEWLQFKDAYEETTLRCKFSDSENVGRLRKCLRGDAKEAVVSMLSGKTDPKIIMQTLGLRFGHPEVIINKIVNQIKKLQPLSQAYHNEIVVFATKIKNFAVTARSIDQADYLRSPELINTVLSKCPSVLINRWGDYVYEHLYESKRSKFEHLSDFLELEAVKAASAGVSHIYSQADKNKKQHEERRGTQHPVLLMTDTEKCNFCKISSHQLPDCPRFKRAMRRDRWRYVRFSKLCFKCLISQHDKQTCPAAACNVDDCGQDHHKLLHWLPKNKNGLSENYVNFIDSEFAVQSNQTETADLSDYVNNINNNNKTVLLKVVSLVVHGPNGSKRACALLDDAASISLVSADLADTLGLRGYSKTLQVQGAWKNTELQCKSEIVNLTITNNTGESFDLCARKMSDLDLAVQKLSSVKFESYEQLKDYKQYVLHVDVKPQLLIGQDHYHLIEPVTIIRGSKNKPYLSRTPLGWCVHGNICAAPAGRLRNDAALLSTRAQPLHHLAPAPPAPAARADSLPMSYQLLPSCIDSANYLQHKVYNINTCYPETVTSVRNIDNWESQEENEALKNLTMMVRHSFELEAIGVTTKPRQSKDELQAISILEDTAKLVNGRWEVGLPWKSDAALPESHSMALRRLLCLERKFKKDVDYFSRYRERINHLFNNGYAREVNTCTITGRIWNLAHFGIDNPNKKKLRVVFDSAATSGGHCLNDFLLQGPDLLQSLLGIMFRFREGSIAWAGDIKDMFLRIRIREEDQNALRFLWRESTSEPVKTYAMTALIFGANCSPFVAQFIKNKNAQRFEADMPDAVNAIIKSHYMDDYLDSHDDEQTAVKIINDVLKIHNDGGFEMRNLTCNKPEILSHMPVETLSPSAIRFKIGGENLCERTLGLLWNPVIDSLGFDMSLKRIPDEILSFKQVPTKREVLRIVMSIFDIYGLLAPFTIKGRIIIQATWKLNINWNDQLPEQLFAAFREWITQMKTIKDLKIPRWYFLSPTQGDTLQLHVYCDASPSAYACVAYWRIVDNNNSIRVAFIASKSRVSPIKSTVTVPRMELQAAVLGCRLATVIENEHRIKPTARFFWSDSSTVLHWIRNENRNYKVFIANRLGEIDSLSKISEWYYVPTSMNIADAATKTNAYKLEANSEWFRGPAFLYLHTNEWPSTSENLDDVDEANLERVLTIDETCHSDLPVPDPGRFSSWRRLLGAMSTVIKFVNKCRRLPEQTEYDIMKQAESLIIRQAQQDTFGKELAALKTFKNIEKSSKLIKLSPFLDEYGVLRAGGRIGAATEIPAETKQPVILDGRHQVSRLIARHYHIQAAHGNQETVVNELKQKYWLIKLRPTVKYISSQCMLCRLRKAKPQVPRMGDLPAARMAHHQRAFTHCGVDLFGPMEVTVGRRREKRYAVLFTCLTVRAVHIEIVCSLTSDSLIMALRRMAARRGWPYCLYSDNATNLRGADIELKRAIQDIDTEALKKVGAAHDINWTFIPPLSPHWGGAWERLIGATKRSLRVILKERAPRDETLATLIAEVEGIMNSRPLTHVAVEPGSQEAITPNHFLIGSSSLLPVPGAFNDSEFFLRKQWRIAQRLADMFWKRWVKEVLPEMIPRTKWNQEVRPLQVGDIVLIVDPDGPRNVWPRGVIEETFAGKDGRVRVVTVRTKSATLKRPATRVALVPMGDECS
ncbi:uncharacterized protein LOC134806062 [Cydia splendana]|uniref:uncharacterized protein LOC134806062 n=1 Tax=Cydia splendana TaxID=1100963 RepID=UPI00300D201F